MIFTPLRLDGVWQLDIERRTDFRGYFARTFCTDEFAAHGLPSAFPQCNVSFNERRGTLRGMHWQAAPHPEGKLVRCSRGAVFDVVVDLRADSPTYRAWLGVELSAENGRGLYIPPGFGHGFQALTGQAEMFYMMTQLFWPALARGVRWNDPAFGINWPVADPILSERDLALPFLSDLTE